MTAKHKPKYKVTKKCSGGSDTDMLGMAPLFILSKLFMGCAPATAIEKQRTTYTIYERHGENYWGGEVTVNWVPKVTMTYWELVKIINGEKELVFNE